MTLLCLIASAGPCFGQARPNRDVADRYWAVWADGSTQTARDVREWSDDKKEPQINGKKLFDKANPVRLLRDTTIDAHLRGSYVEFVNGDILPGRVVGGSGPDPEKGLPAHLLVAPASPLSMKGKGAMEVAVRPEHVVRVVRATDESAPPAARGELEPGAVWFTDGHRIRVKALRWASSGIRGLTEGGTFAAGWHELAEVQPPDELTGPAWGDAGRLTAILEDITAPCVDPQSLVGRVAVENGAVLTYRHAMMRVDRRDDNKPGLCHLIQPAWALGAICVPFDSIVHRSYRQHNEVPLSQLPGETLAQSSYTGFVWPWRRNLNVRQTALASGDVLADIGIGTHSYSAIAFDLPAGATQFTTWVGLDQAVGAGGCVKLAVRKEKADGGSLWKSDFLRGSDPPQRVGPVDVRNVKRLVLVTDFANDGRPKGADPLDIRDEVDWLAPMVQIDPSKAPRPDRGLDAYIPQARGWEVPADRLKEVQLTPWWDERRFRWTWSMFRKTTGEVEPTQVLFELKRRLIVTPLNAWLEIAAGRDENGPEGHLIDVYVNGEEYGSIMNGPIQTNKARGTMDERKWSLGPLAGKQIELSVRVHPRAKGTYQPPGVLWDAINLGPIITDLPPEGRPIHPDVLITTLKAADVRFHGPDEYKLAPGKLVDGKPLTLRGYPLADGYGMPAGQSDLTYDLDPSWKRFVAVIGLADGSGSAGPYTILLDGKDHWTSPDPISFGRHTPGQQIEVDIPAGHKTITLRIEKKSTSFGAWGEAGFMKK